MLPFHQFSASRGGLLRDLFPFLTRLGKAYGNGLFAALDSTTFAATATFRGAALIAMHFALNILARTRGVSALRLLCHYCFLQLSKGNTAAT
jgi:hypothetical protein